MKANNKSKTIKEDKEAYAKVVGGLVALMVTIIIAILVYWNISTSMPAMSTQADTFTGYTVGTTNASSGGSNQTAQEVTLTYYPESITNITCYNATGHTFTSPTNYTTSGRVLTVPSDMRSYASANPRAYTQINVTYTTKIATDTAHTNTQATTMFQLLPIIAIVVVGGILIGLVIAFGGGSRKV